MDHDRIEHLFTELAYHIGEGRLSEEDEEMIIEIEETYRETNCLSERQINVLERRLRWANIK